MIESTAFVAVDSMLKSGKLLVIDGATGSELELRGVEPDPGAWSGPTWLDRREILQNIHEDYIRAGADILITNTFCTARHQLEPVGYGELVERANREAVEVALAARDAAADGRPVAIAGSVSHAFANPGERFRVVERGTRFDDAEALRASYREQIDRLAKAGVDLLALETMQRPETARIALEEAFASGLPVWLGLSIGHAGDNGAIMCFDQKDVALSDTLDALLDDRLWAVLVMHTEIEDTAPALDAVRARWKGPLGAYPHSGFITFPNWHQDAVIGSADFAAAARGWRDQGAGLIGGCCGIGPSHIAALRDQIA
ncbi:MAG: homocysteine S-methyltransferase family protein [Alphaproteobacteria bacterium]|jgi:S-methylmethionine-dependent homocysteine/selenocysteine methylase|nr:homocysteine S-methyltransferase family protein [Rhodospirillaceae bacterium]MBT6206238.1 homocysteine S-methyltransferase family protein [Rhodospirillaceae bacterium]MBT6511000.1 homocysteine S-methyltransferase family protein [Rhodospirillaceae bacterium]MBT7612513.1 homocysteine S-methyltransferase family protein [Rhodospirillaceae bacterium]MDG2479409.1 homocysteine S-methyltransferase family protein [Alphaproteobacteria bacterium]